MKKYLNKPDEVAEDKILRRSFTPKIKSIDPEKRTIEFIISTATADRYGDIVEVSGWDLKAYKANPVVLFGHMSSIPPIGKCLKVWKDAQSLRAIAEFMPRDISAFADSIFRMFVEGYLRATSVGFRPLKWERLVDDDGNETWAYRFKKQELLEFSAVPIPANPEALVAARQKGIDTVPFKSWAEEMLDNWGNIHNVVERTYGIDRKQVENIRRRAAGYGTSIRVSPEIQDELMTRNLAAIRAAKAARENSKSTQEITLRGHTVSLPVLGANDIEAGKVVVSTDEINGKKSFHVDRADESVIFSKELVGSDKDQGFMQLAVTGEGEEKSLQLTLKSDDGDITYNLIGLDANEDLYGIKAVKDDHEDEEEEEKKTEDEDEDESDEDKSGDEDEEEKGDDTDDEDDESKSDDESEDEDEESKSEDEDEEEKKTDDEDEEEKSDDEDEEEEKKLTVAERIAVTEMSLLALEGQLDKSGMKAQTKHEQRKLRFLAGYMRELADLLDGGAGKASKAFTLTVDKAVKEEEESDEITSVEDLQKHLSGFAEDLKPLLSKMVESTLSKRKGRLD